VQEAINLTPASIVDGFSNCSIQSVPTVASRPELSLLEFQMFLSVQKTSTDHILTRLESVQPYSTIQLLECVRGVLGIQVCLVCRVCWVYRCAGYTECAGCTWCAGYRECAGYTGVRGVQGLPCVQNVPGIQGVHGIQGVSGVQNVPGIQGVPGIQSALRKH
jgi:hypothetical protein